MFLVHGIHFFDTPCIEVIFALFFISAVAAEVRAKRVSEVHVSKSAKNTSDLEFGTSWRDIPRVTLIILRNPTFIFITLAGTVTLMVGAGFATFISKYIQNQMNLAASTAATYSGKYICLTSMEVCQQHGVDAFLFPNHLTFPDKIDGMLRKPTIVRRLSKKYM